MKHPNPMTYKMKQPILQISIPTRNRPEELVSTLSRLKLVVDCLPVNELSIVIFDNSDQLFKAKNRFNLPPYVKYQPNSSNIGYQRNILRCVTEVEAEFVWVLPDDDDVNSTELLSLIKFLLANRDNISAVAIPIAIYSETTKKTVLDISVAPKFGQVVKLKDLIDNKKIIFDYLGGFIFKPSNEFLISIEPYLESVYIQAAILLKTLSPTSRVYIHNKPLIRWVGQDTIRWNPKELLISAWEIQDLVDDLFTIKSKRKYYAEQLIKWCILSRAGLYSMADLNIHRLTILKMASKYVGIKILLWAVLLYSPSLLLSISFKFFILFKNKGN
jgi:hypothetical protein